MTNEMRLDFAALPVNEGFARVVIGAFAAQLDPTVEELEDVRTAVSEAVTNAIVHGYAEKAGMVRLAARIKGRELEVEVTDCGGGIPDIEQAMQPLYTSRPDMERSGMGFTMMQSFMDGVQVQSAVGRGTTVRMTKTLRAAGDAGGPEQND